MNLLALGNTFLRTKLITDKPSICNSVSNIALAPLQFIIGQKIFEIKNGCLKARITPVSTYTTVFKVIICSAAAFVIRKSGYTKKALGLFIAAAFIGVVARGLSLSQKDMGIALSTIYLSHAPKSSISKTTPKPKTVDFAKSLKAKITRDIAFFKLLKTELEKSPDAALQWLNEQRNNGYSYPFYTFKSLQNRLTEIPPEAQQIVTPEYLDSYNACEAMMLDSAFDSFFDEQDPDHRPLAEFLKAWNALEGSPSLPS